MREALARQLETLESSCFSSIIVIDTYQVRVPKLLRNTHMTKLAEPRTKLNWPNPGFTPGRPYWQNPGKNYPWPTRQVQLQPSNQNKREQKVRSIKIAPLGRIEEEDDPIS
jgi:hypothetical protein